MDDWMRPARAAKGVAAMQWVTRTGVRIDRAAMIWLIRRSIDPDAEIIFQPDAEAAAFAETTGAVLFHHAKSEFRNTGARTGFDALRVHYDLQDPALAVMALVLRGAETNDRALTPWSAGLWALGSGLRRLTADDEQFVAEMSRLLDGLYRFCQDQLAPAAIPPRRPAGQATDGA